MENLWGELKRRNIFRVAVAYGILSWLLVQITSIASPALFLPDWTVTMVVFLSLLGFPVALFLAWAYELTPEGLKPTQSVAQDHSITLKTGQNLNRLIIGLLSLAVIVLLGERLLPKGQEPTRADIQVAEPESRVRDSIAVLPFVNMSADPEQEFFSDGMSEELLNLLARTKGLRVAARTSSFAFKGKNEDIKDIGRKLAVETVLEGSVRRSGQMLRITAQLIDVETGYHLWSDTYDRELSNIFAIQDEISEAIVQSLQVHLTGVEATPAKSRETDFEAYNNYLIARGLVARRKEEFLQQALVFYDKALAIDPNYAPAYSGKAVAVLLSNRFFYGHILWGEDERQAQVLIDQALAIDPDDPTAFAAQGLLQNGLLSYSEWDETIAMLERAVELNPSDADAHMWLGTALSSVFRLEEALRSYLKAAKLDPVSLNRRSNLVGAYVAMGDIEKAHLIIEDTLKTFPDQERVAMSLKYSRFSNVVSLSDAYRGFDSYITNPANKGEVNFPPLFHAYELWQDDIVRSYEYYPRYEVFLPVEGLESAIESFGLLSERNKTVHNNLHLLLHYMQIGEPEKAIVIAERYGDEGHELGYPLYPDEHLLPVVAADVIVAYRQVGETEKAEVALAKFEENLAAMEENGLWYRLPLFKAMFYAVKGDDATAIAQLKIAQEEHHIFRDNLDRPAFDGLRESEAFKEIEASYLAYINGERAKLGWEPVN